tara:strand:- start:832 stop:2028 length:1197 start_codon:yes stop_codon:yes gene_type:complete
MKNLKEKIKAYALKNAMEHEKAKEGSVISGLFHEGLKKDNVGKIINDVKKEVKRVNSLSEDELQKEFLNLKKLPDKRKERKGLLLLPHKGKVIMRFAPSASGPLHIAHAFVAALNLLYVKKYGGIFYVRIEDTNPENVYMDSYDMLKQDSKWLSGGKAKIIIQSNRMNLYYKYIDKLLKKDKAYVCTCEQDKFKEFIKNMENCDCRNLDKKEQVKRYKKMLSRGKDRYKEREAVLRFKSGMKNKNPAFRDFPLARINEKEHSLQGKKYRVWPLMNLAVTVDDIEQKMTHVIRGKEHRDNAERQKMIFKVLKKKYPWTAYLGRLHFKGLSLSTSGLRKAIEEGKYKGWDDKKLPTLASLRKQGYKPEAFLKLAEHIGLSEVDKKIEKKEYFQLLNQFNR